MIRLLRTACRLLCAARNSCRTDNDLRGTRVLRPPCLEVSPHTGGQSPYVPGGQSPYISAREFISLCVPLVARNTSGVLGSLHVPAGEMARPRTRLRLMETIVFQK